MKDKIMKIICLVFGLILGVIVLFGSFYTVKEQEQAVLITFGQAKAITETGLHFKIPFIQSVVKVDTTIKGLNIGFFDSSTASHDSFFEGLLENGTDEEIAQYETLTNESLMITSDYNFVNVDFFVEYRVTDPVKAIYESDEPVGILKNIAQSCIRTVVGSYTVDEVLTTGKNEIQAAIKTMIMEKLENQDLGLSLVNITIQDSEPPTVEVMEAFKAVETAKQEKETAINNANKYMNERLPEAEATSDGITKTAEATKAERINEAIAQVSRFNAMYEEYIKNPDITKERMYYEAMESVLPDLKVIIESGSGDLQTLYPIESFVTSNQEDTIYE